MQKYQGPCYSLEEAQEILSMRPSELGHAIRMKTITPVVYTKSRRMLIFSYRNRRNYGHATCLYRGHFSLPDNHIAVLLEGDSITLSNNFGTLLDPEGVQNYGTTYPFKQLTPNNWLYDWNSIKQDTLVLDAARATPLPIEHRPTSKTILELAEVLMSQKNSLHTDNSRTKVENDVDALVFNFKSNSAFEPHDLRIPASEIASYKLQLVVSSVNPVAEKHYAPSDTATTRARTNQLHTLITRILIANPKITAKATWQIIQQDVKLEERLFDTEDILLVVDHDCIEWKSHHGKEQAIRWTSFQPLLSKLRREITDNQPSPLA